MTMDTTDLTEVQDTAGEACSAGQQVLDEAPRLLEALGHLPDRPLLPQLIQHQRQVEPPHRKLIHLL